MMIYRVLLPHTMPLNLHAYIKKPSPLPSKVLAITKPVSSLDIDPSTLSFKS